MSQTITKKEETFLNFPGVTWDGGMELFWLAVKAPVFGTKGKAPRPVWKNQRELEENHGPTEKNETGWSKSIIQRKSWIQALPVQESVQSSASALWMQGKRRIKHLII